MSSDSPNPEQSEAIAKELQKEKDGWKALKEKAEAEGRWGEARVIAPKSTTP